MNLNQLLLFQQAITAYNINHTLLLKDGSNLPHIDNGFRMSLYEKNPYYMIQSFLTSYVKPESFIRYVDEFEMIYFYIYIPENYISELESPYFVIGPFLESIPSDDQIHSIMERLHLPEELFHDITFIYSAIPLMEKNESFESLIFRLACELFKTNYQMAYFPNQPVFMEYSPVSLQLRQKPQLVLANIENRYDIENQMLLYLSKGDTIHAYEYYRKLGTFPITPRSEQVLQNQRHHFIILNTLFRKAVETSGVHPLYIDELSSKFAVLIYQLQSKQEFHELAKQMVHKYCLLVKNHAMKGYSQVIKDIISYIDFHYAEDLSLSFFSQMFNLTKPYLSSLFKKETGSTLTDFIHQVRIRRAITMINSSSLTIHTIATSCGYHDINYFIRIFKRTYGMSPKQYQKSILKHQR